MSIDSLSEVQGTIMTYTALHTERVPVDPHHPLPQLLVRLDETHTLRILGVHEPSEEQAENSSVYYFLARFPYPIAQIYEAKLQRILSLFNHLLPLGMLELNREEGIYFRHMLLAEEDVLDGLLGLDIVLALEQLLPQIFDWLAYVLAQREEEELDALTRERFRDIIRSIPTSPLAPLSQQRPARSRSSHVERWIFFSFFCAGLGLGLSGWLYGLLVGAFCLALGGLTHYLYKRFSEQQKLIETQQQELRFFWQLLESEHLKLQFCDQALERHRAEVAHKLSVLAQSPITYPSDIVKLRSQSLFLQELQNHLAERFFKLKLKRQELEHNRSQLLEQRQDLNSTESLSIDSDLSCEDQLMQSLKVTLEYLNFQVHFAAPQQMPSPTLFVSLREHLPPVSVYWLHHWVPGQSRGHSWMLCFDLALDLPAISPSRHNLQALMEIFNRFLPLGALIVSPHQQKLVLRYRFVRLKGDLSAILIMEILEVMASFGERLHKRVQEYISAAKPLELILAETEREFEALAR